MATEFISSDEVAFEVEARLLQELGERLVASADVALLELIKNASDADAPECRVILTTKFGKPVLIIADDGAGMSEDDFRHRWMRIAADSRRDPFTKRYGRAVTGQKGIGRFAIRYLGAAMKLESVSVDSDTGELHKLTAIFDWRRLDKKVELRRANVRFWVQRMPAGTCTGTVLTVSRLKRDLYDAVDKSLLTRILAIVSPISTFDLGHFSRRRRRTTVVSSDSPILYDDSYGALHDISGLDEDPGFRVTFVGFPHVDEHRGDIAKTVIENSWARLNISLRGNKLRYSVKFRGEDLPHIFSVDYLNSIGRGLHGDIAFAPKRKNSFTNLGADGREVWGWIRKNSGIGVVDNGFRIRPYGFNDDDWLFLNYDGAHNNRYWRSSVSKNYYPLSEVEMARPGLNPALNLPTGYQVIGVVAVASRASNDPSELDLIPSMDREGFLNNAAYAQMVDVVRGGLEYLAYLDKKRQLKTVEDQALASRNELREDLAEVIDDIESDPRLAREEKTALVQHYSTLAARVAEQEEYDRAARQRLEIASGLGVVAGFMTHEAERLFLALDSVIEKLEKKLRSTAEQKDLEEIKSARMHLDNYIRYTRLYTESLRATEHRSFSALGQIEWVCDSFGPTAESRGIATDIDCADDVMVPPVPVAMYSAVLLNLYTNATKAVIARDTDDLAPRILISAWNDQKYHYLSVQDNGVGIPPSMRKRIWDPFFTTTSRVNSPLGTGMGLGLSLVRDLVQREGGDADVGEPSPGFTTCIRVSLPRRANVH
ncbi:sensor histidine kinase [Burkholderia gladioli]|uniref:sensor histidine kinase n=1 Tax=Burkholderia gladioli TaxID=28095 RepID=UPI00163DFA51|nr:sensor histidine kinase [Burkholderia gladioli]